MKLTFYLLFLGLSGFVGKVHSQNIYDARQSVILEAIVQDTPAQIKLNWVKDTANGGYTIWRKNIFQESWGDSLVFLPPDRTTWTDTSVVAGVGYEYQIIKSLPAFPYGNGTPNFGSGYIFSGIKVQPKHHRGSCLVLLDSRFQVVLNPEIARLLDDLTLDGWRVDTIHTKVTTPVVEVKNKIFDWFRHHPDTDHALFLLGRIPVPYSGDIAPDGHHSDHRGAWPCDGYYGTNEGIWTDQTVNNKTAASSRNDNIPGDGKFDNNVMPSPVVLQIGRVDFSNMNKFPESEEQLLRRYLDKNHAWRMGKMQMTERGLVDNNFGDIEGLGQTGWRNFGPMFGLQQVKDVPYRSSLSQQGYLWSYGCGGGGPESASDISSTTGFTTDSLQTMFTLLFGSYFGDWDYPNNFLRGAIASRTCLASTWGNRPVWFFHHMALGETIGYSTKITMNNRGLYTPRFYGGYVSTALMGDPTLRMHAAPPIERVTARQEGTAVHLDWKGLHPEDTYFIYRQYAGDSTYHLLNHQAVTDTFFVDPCIQHGLIQYMVRRSELKTSGSGSYYNLSQGVAASVWYDSTAFSIESDIIPAQNGQSNGSVTIRPTGGCAPYTFRWDNGETTSSRTGLPAGHYCVTINDCTLCSKTYCAIVGEVSALEAVHDLLSGKIYPNPTGSHLNMALHFQQEQHLSLTIQDMAGKILGRKFVSGRDILLPWDVTFLPPGPYVLLVSNGRIPYTFSFIKIP